MSSTEDTDQIVIDEVITIDPAAVKVCKLFNFNLQ